MKIVLDLFPILLFFATFKFATIYEATAVLMAATLLQSLLMYRLEGKLATMQKLTLVLIVVFGGLTLILQDDRFIKFKPTLFYGCAALGLFFSQIILKKNFFKTMLGSQFNLPDANWQTLGLSLIGYCIFMATTNAYVAHEYSTEEWVYFKFLGYVFPLILVAGIIFYINKHLVPTEPAADDEAAN
jgi:intracellular septation protein